MSPDKAPKDLREAILGICHAWAAWKQADGFDEEIDLIENKLDDAIIQAERLTRECHEGGAVMECKDVAHSHLYKLDHGGSGIWFLVARGMMVSNPRAGETFRLLIGRTCYRTSTVQEVTKVSSLGIEFRTLNSNYLIRDE